MASNDVQIFNPPDHETGGPYSHIASIPLSNSSRLVVFAGQIGRDSSTRKIPSTLAEQIKIALKNVDICLEAVGGKRNDIVQVRQYLVNLHPVDKTRVDLYREWMGGHNPPSTVVGVERLAIDKLLYEIEVTAVVRDNTPDKWLRERL